MADTDSLNDQIRDAVEQIQALLAGSSSEMSVATSQQLMAHAAALAMLNAVAQQQNAYILRNAVTAAAARAMLASDPEKAVELARELLGDERLGDPLAELRQLMREVAASAGAAAGATGGDDGPASKARNSSRGTKRRSKAGKTAD